MDLLDKDDRPWFLVVGDGRRSRVFSNLGKENVQMLKDWLEDGHWNRILSDHINFIEEKE